MRDDHNIALGARAEPAAVPAGPRLQGGHVRRVKARLGRPVWRQVTEVEPGVLGIGLEDFARLRTVQKAWVR